MNSLSLDLRRRIVAAYERNEGTYFELAQRFGVGEATVSRLLRRQRELGHVVPEAAGGGFPPRIPEDQFPELLRLVAEMPNPVTTADASCPAGYKALFAYGSVRRATTTPNKVANPIDWVIRPYTYYVTMTDNPIWLTDATALLGVRNGQFAKLENNMYESTQKIFTGLNANWTTLGSDNCNGWAASTGYHQHYGFAYSQQTLFLYNEITDECSNSQPFYCIEQ